MKWLCLLDMARKVTSSSHCVSVCLQHGVYLQPISALLWRMLPSSEGVTQTVICPPNINIIIANIASDEPRKLLCSQWKNSMGAGAEFILFYKKDHNIRTILAVRYWRQYNTGIIYRNYILSNTSSILKIQWKYYIDVQILFLCHLSGFCRIFHRLEGESESGLSRKKYISGFW